MHLNATCNDRTETQQFPFTGKQQMKENGWGGGGGGSVPFPLQDPLVDLRHVRSCRALDRPRAGL